jgi:hypothetical protein
LWWWQASALRVVRRAGGYRRTTSLFSPSNDQNLWMVLGGVT